MKKQDLEQLTLFPAASPVSRSALPGSDEARRMTVISGRKCSELYASCGPVGSLVRMLLGSSIWRSTRCILTWKTKVTPSKRLLFRLVPSMLRTEGIGRRYWPTPTSRDGKGANSMEHLATGNHVAQLANAVKLFPTPTTGAGLCGGTGNYQQLQALEASGQITPEERRSMTAGNGGQLNPDWVEWLMGYPIGWSEV